MRKFLLFLVTFAAMSAPAQSVNSPCYWSGQLVKCFPTTGIYLDGNRSVRYGETTGNGANYVEVKAPAALGSDFVMTLPAATDTFVGKATTDVLTNKTLSGNTATSLISGSGTLTLNTSGTITVPNATDTLVGKATTDVLTNKTLTGNTAVNLISGSGTFVHNTTGTITAPNATDTLVGQATTDTLTNKTLTSPKLNENVAVTTTATKLNLITSAGGTTGTTSTNLVFSTSPTLVTPILGAASATSLVETVTTNSSTGAIDNLAWTSGVIEFTGVSAITLSGLACPGGATCSSTYNGLTVKLINIGGAVLTVKNDVTSTAANRFVLPSAAAGLAIPNVGSATFTYDNARWRLTGAPQTTYLYSTYTAVAGTDVAAISGGLALDASPVFNKVTIWKSGSLAKIRWDYKSDSAGSAGSGNYEFVMPSGLTIDTTYVQPLAVATAAGTGTCGIISVTDGTNEMQFYAQVASSTLVQFRQIVNGTSTTSWNSGSTVNFADTAVSAGMTIEVPITEWAQ